MEVDNMNAILKTTRMTVPELAQAFGMSTWQIYNIKQGKTPMPSELIVKLADLVRVSPSEFKSKDLSKLIKNMVIVINRLPEEEKEEAIAKLREQVAQLQASLTEAHQMVIRLQSQLLEKK